MSLRLQARPAGCGACGIHCIPTEDDTNNVCIYTRDCFPGHEELGAAGVCVSLYVAIGTTSDLPTLETVHR